MMRLLTTCSVTCLVALTPAVAVETVATVSRAKSTLARQEERVTQLQAQRGAVLTEGQQKEFVKAAHAFATSVARDNDARYVAVFAEAVRLAAGDAVRSGQPTPALALPPADGAPRTRIADVMPRQETIFDDPVYAKNARRLYGSLSPRIVGGVPTTEYPDCVAVGNGSGWCCTGTLVAPNVVITAGHCHGGCASRVFVGHNVFDQGRVVNVKDAVRHPDYASGGLHNDLSVLILEEEVDNVPPRAFASAAAINNAFFVRAVGFGTTDNFGSTGYGIKRVVDVPIASHDCSTDAAQTRYGCDKGLEIVAGKPLLNQDSCNGDSGGPVYVEHEGKLYLAGATSRATDDSPQPCGHGGIYVRLEKFESWVKSVPGGSWPANGAAPKVKADNGRN